MHRLRHSAGLRREAHEGAVHLVLAGRGVHPKPCLARDPSQVRKAEARAADGAVVIGTKLPEPPPSRGPPGRGGVRLFPWLAQRLAHPVAGAVLTHGGPRHRAPADTRTTRGSPSPFAAARSGRRPVSAALLRYALAAATTRAMSSRAPMFRQMNNAAALDPLGIEDRLGQRRFRGDRRTRRGAERKSGHERMARGYLHGLKVFFRAVG